MAGSVVSPGLRDGKASLRVAAILSVAASVTFSCSAIEEQRTGAGPSPSPSPGVAAPGGPLGPLVEAGRVESVGSGFALTIPEGWLVEVASPDPDVTAAPPASAWEALRTYPADGSATCSVYVGIPPSGYPLDPERPFFVDHSTSVSWPRWDVGPEGPQLGLPRLFDPGSGRAASRGRGEARQRQPGSHPALPLGAQYALDCWWVSGDEVEDDEGQSEPPVTLPESFTLLELE